MRAAVLIVAICAGGCATSSAGQVSPLAPAVIGDRERAAVESGLRSVMKDAASAQFGSMSAGRNEKGTLHVCGMVNGRNGFGGYTGFQPFTGILAELGQGERQTLVFMPAEFGWDAIAEKAVRDRCKALGLQL